MDEINFLMWLHNRLINVYKESPDADFVIKLKKLAEKDVSDSD